MASETRVGLGFDVHRFCTPEEAVGRKLMLGGLAFDYKPLAGHSDADVMLHALCDALLGAIGEGDIGRHFPPHEAKWKDADSTLLLKTCFEKVLVRRGRILNLDLCLIGERPKLEPRRDEMRTHLAKLLNIEESRINLKATTTEQLGFTGRGEGLACQALVSLRVPA